MRVMHEPCGGHAKGLMKKHGREWREDDMSDVEQISCAFDSVGMEVVIAWAHEMEYHNHR